MSEKSSIIPRKVMRNGARSLDWRDRNWLMHAGASGVVYVNRVKYGEVGSAVLLSDVPVRRAVEDVE